MSMIEPTAERNRLDLIIELAIRTRLKEAKQKKRARPTIDELEKILNRPDPPEEVNILPDGSIETTEQTAVFAADLASAVIKAIYADGWKIVPQTSESPACDPSAQAGEASCR
jgi:hypothetical protein